MGTSMDEALGCLQSTVKIQPRCPEESASPAILLMYGKPLTGCE